MDWNNTKASRSRKQIFITHTISDLPGKCHVPGDVNNTAVTHKILLVPAAILLTGNNHSILIIRASISSFVFGCFDSDDYQQLGLPGQNIQAFTI